MKKQKSVLLMLLVFATICLMAQSLPGTQQNPLRAPASIKIDGKPNEWGNKFQAYNHANDVYYTLANDDNNLYIVIQATDIKVIRRIFNGGISFNINKKQKKDDAQAIGITYPIFESNGRMSVSDRALPVIVPGDEKSVMKADSFMLVNNNRLEVKSKNIRIKNMKGLDTVISVYNENNIKVAQSFDNKLIYTCEIAIPLDKLELSVTNAPGFFYHMMINEVIEHGITIERNAEGKITRFTSAAGAQAGQPATDFWAEYKLAK